MSKISWRFHEMTEKLLKRSSCKTRISLRRFSLESKPKAVKLSYKLFEPECYSDYRLPPLLFLHGVTGAKEAAWKDIPQRISDKTKRKAYNLDARNHGDSDWSDEFDFDLNTVDLLNFMDEMGFPKVVTIGHSMGGNTAIRAALEEPERFEMVFIEEQFVKKLPQNLMDKGLVYMNLYRDVEKFIPPGVGEEEADLFVTEYLRQKTKTNCRPPSDRRNRVDYPMKKSSSGRYRFTANLEVILPKLRHTESLMSENEGIYHGPSYFLFGTKSPYGIEKEKDHILKHFPKAVFMPFETYKHCVHKDFPDLFVDVVSKCINESEKKGYQYQYPTTSVQQIL